MRRLLAALVLAVVVLPHSARAETGRRGTVSAEALAMHINYLASDELGGRGVDTEGIDLAAEYIARLFLKHGLLPGGDEGSYFQWFDVATRSRITERCRLEVVGRAITCKLNEDFTPMPFSSPEPFEGKMAFVGYGVADEAKDYDDYAGIDVNGKVLLMLRGNPTGWGAEDAGRANRRSTFRRRLILAQVHGAAAVVVVNPPTDDEDNLYRFRRPRPGALPMFQVTRSLANRLLRAGGLESIEKLHDKIEKTHAPASADLAGVNLKGDPGVQSGSVKAKNVIGILPGAGPLADEYVVIGGHYDHLGNVPPHRMPQLVGDFDPADAKIHNGADDNASGTAGVLELARIYASGPPPARSVVFIAFSAEESGLLGSRHYVEHPTVPLKDVVAMLNLDMIGRLDGRAVQLFATDSAVEFDDMVQRHGGSVSGLEVEPMGRVWSASDHAPFYGKDIPVLFLFSGMHSDYHRPSDDYDKIDYRGATSILRFAQAIGDELIESETRPTFQKAPGGFGLKVRMGFMPDASGFGDETGFAVGDVIPDGPAARAGMKPGDIIITINDKKVSNFADYMQVLAPSKPGDVAEVVVRRGSKKINLKVKLGAR